MKWFKTVLLALALSGCAGIDGVVRASATKPTASSQKAAPASAPRDAARADPEPAEPAEPAEPTRTQSVRAEPAPAQPSDDTIRLGNWRRSCTLGGTVSDPCVAFHKDVLYGHNPEKVSRSAQDVIQSCFADAESFEKQPGSRGNQPHSAETLLLRPAESDEPGFDSSYAKECIRLTAEQHGKEWLQDATRAALYAQVRRSVGQDFQTKCGVRAQLTSEGDPPSVALYGRAKSSKVFANQSDAYGNKLVVKCSGVVEAKSASGKLITRAPKSAERLIASRNASCNNNCQMTAPICREGFRRGHVTPECEELCREKCH
jgi:hypothetical protein